MSCTIQGQIHHFLKFWNLRWFPKLSILSIWHLLLVFFVVFIFISCVLNILFFLIFPRVDFRLNEINFFLELLVQL